MTTHRTPGPWTKATEDLALSWSEFLYALGHPWEGRHLAGRHMRGYVDEAFAMQCELTAGFSPGGKRLATKAVAA